MDLQEQLKNLFPEHKPSETIDSNAELTRIWIQDEPIICKYEKRKGNQLPYLKDIPEQSRILKLWHKI